jgi:O-antigen/teichoic acid export membrane protein
MGPPVAIDRRPRRISEERGGPVPPTIPRLQISRAIALRAVSWSTAGTVGSAVLAFGRSAVLAHLLRPEDFGLFGLALFAAVAANQFTDFGLSTAALVERFDSADEQDRFLGTVWTAQLGRAAGLGLLVLAGAATYGRIMGDTRLASLLAALAIWPLLVAAGNPGLLVMQRQLDQRPLAQMRWITETLGLILTVGAAWVWRSPWALILGFLASAALGCAGSHLVAARRPVLHFDRALLRRGIRLGKYAAMVAALALVTTQVDNLIVGRILGAAVLGIYLFAYRVASLPVEVIQSAFSGVMVPLYAGLRDQGLHDVRRHFSRVLSITTTALCSVLVPAFFLRREIVAIVGGTHWSAAVPLLPPLLLLVLLRGTMIQLGTLLSGLGRIDLDARSKMAEAALFVPACVVGVHALGAAGAAWAGAASYGLGVAVRLLAVSRVLSVPAHRVARSWLRVIVVALGCVAAGGWLEAGGASHLLVAPVAAVALAGAMLGIDPALRYEARRLCLRLV